MLLLDDAPLTSPSIFSRGIRVGYCYVNESYIYSLKDGIILIIGNLFVLDALRIIFYTAGRAWPLRSF